MRWTDVSSRLPLQSLEALADRESMPAEIAQQPVAVTGMWIAIRAAAHAAVLHHLGSHREERGGLLLERCLRT
jgi:hypothetical protein